MLLILLLSQSIAVAASPSFNECNSAYISTGDRDFAPVLQQLKTQYVKTLNQVANCVALVVNSSSLCMPQLHYMESVVKNLGDGLDSCALEGRNICADRLNGAIKTAQSNAQRIAATQGGDAFGAQVAHVQGMGSSNAQCSSLQMPTIRSGQTAQNIGRQCQTSFSQAYQACNIRQAIMEVRSQMLSTRSFNNLCPQFGANLRSLELKIQQSEKINEANSAINSALISNDTAMTERTLAGLGACESATRNVTTVAANPPAQVQAPANPPAPEQAPARAAAATVDQAPHYARYGGGGAESGGEMWPPAAVQGAPAPRSVSIFDRLETIHQADAQQAAAAAAPAPAAAGITPPVPASVAAQSVLATPSAQTSFWDALRNLFGGSRTASRPSSTYIDNSGSGGN